MYSISGALKNGFSLGNYDAVMKLMKGNTTLYFDRILKSEIGFVFGITLIPMLGNFMTSAVESNKVKNNIDNNIIKFSS
jgi:hypothetical protein